MPYHGGPTSNGGPVDRDGEVPDFDGKVSTATDKPVTLQVETPNLPRVASQGHDRPGGVGLHIPNLDGLVMRPTHNPVTIKLNTADASSVTLQQMSDNYKPSFS